MEIKRQNELHMSIPKSYSTARIIHEWDSLGFNTMFYAFMPFLLLYRKMVVVKLYLAKIILELIQTPEPMLVVPGAYFKSYLNPIIVSRTLFWLRGGAANMYF